DRERADAAASVLGPESVGKLIDALLELAPRIRTDRPSAEAYSGLERRIAHVPGASLVEAIDQRSAALDSEQMARLAAVFSRRPEGDSDRGRPFNADAIRTIQGLVQDWGKRMLADQNAQRWQRAAIATLASHVPDVSLLPLLKEMLDDNLTRLRAFRAEAEATRGRQSEALNEARQPMTGEYQRAFLAIKTPETAAIMRGYLEDLDFGPLAARVLADQWRTENEPPKDKRFLGGIDWSDVRAKRSARAANPAATCDEAETIFAAIDRLIADGTTQEQQRLAVALGITALRLPHGQRDATIKKLISFAPREGYLVARCDLLLSLVLSGEVIDIADVVAGINETMEAAKTHTWILTQSEGFYVKNWLRLLPFVNKPAEGLPVLLGMPPAQRDVYFLRDLVRSYCHSPAVDEAEKVLFGLADSDARFYGQHEWREAVISLETSSSARRLVDLIAGGSFSGKSMDEYHLVTQLGAMIVRDAELRRYVHSMLKDGVTSNGLALLAGAVAEAPDEDGLLLLVKCEQQGHTFRSWRTIEGAVTEHVPVNDFANAYNVVPVAAPELRRKLFALTTDGGPKDVAARWLTHIDAVRDEYGLPEGEPRHPDLASAKPWPIMTPDPDATTD
ncbi:MAG: hypothetical protein Q8K85_17985, partial [Hyphomicrobium sp.]|nr:hypothetical protein [Hyphomicrobium sp.]